MASLPAVIPAILIVAIVAYYVIAPLMGGAEAETGIEPDDELATYLNQRADLLARRRELYAQIRDLDFDYSTDKIAETDYKNQRHKLVAEAVYTLKGLDRLPDPEHDPIEVAVAAYKDGGTVIAESASKGGFCPNCGQAARSQDKFCGSCGADLRRENESYEVAQN